MLERSALQPDLARAVRAATAFSAALLICAWCGVPLAAQYAATAALGLSMPQLRGAYPMRVLLLAVMISVISGAAFLGGLAGGHLLGAVAGMGLLALLSAGWRHLSADYGPALAIDSALLYLLALEGARHGATPGQMALWTALGGTGAAVLQLGLWLFRPQHPLRHAVAEAWVAASDLFLTLVPGADGSPPPPAAWNQQQKMLRETLDRTAATLTAAGTPSRARERLVGDLRQMLHEAAHLAMQMDAFHTAGAQGNNDTPESPGRRAARETFIHSLADLARSVAITLITHRRRNLLMTLARVQTCRNLIAVCQEESEASAPEVRLLEAMQLQLTSLETSLKPLAEPSGERPALPRSLPDLGGKSMPAIAAWLNSAPKIDPSLVRYSLRMALLSMTAVAVYLAGEIPRGYWMAFAVIVVLQPDYGATRQRARQRVAGTVAGALLASLTLAFPPPLWVLGGLTSIMAFCFAYFLKRRYGLAVFFVTVMVVLLAELHVPVHLDFTAGRLLSNLAGALLALLAAAWFWPGSERTKLPALVGAAVRANRSYFQSVTQQHLTSGTFHPEIVRAKQQAERAAYAAAGSLQKLAEEPGQSAALVQRESGILTANDRIRRAIHVLALELEQPQAGPVSPAFKQVADGVQAALEDLAAVAETPAASITPGPTPGCGMDVPMALAAVRTEVRGLARVMHEMAR